MRVWVRPSRRHAGGSGCGPRRPHTLIGLILDNLASFVLPDESIYIMFKYNGSHSSDTQLTLPRRCRPRHHRSFHPRSWLSPIFCTSPSDPSVAPPPSGTCVTMMAARVTCDAQKRAERRTGVRRPGAQVQAAPAAELASSRAARFCHLQAGGILSRLPTALNISWAVPCAPSAASCPAGSVPSRVCGRPATASPVGDGECTQVHKQVCVTSPLWQVQCHEARGRATVCPFSQAVNKSPGDSRGTA